MRRFLFFLVLVVGFLLAACGSGRPSIAMEANSFDFGSVVNGDIVSRNLTLRNEGESDLVIDSVVTSCSCTEATVNPLTIPAGQSGILHIEFDSGLHGPDLTGPLIRQVFISSNDPKNPEFQVELNIYVEANSSPSG